MRGSQVKVEIKCDRTGWCCAVRGKDERVCDQEYKFPFAHFNISKRQRGEIDRGYPLRKLVGKFTWFDMVDAWGEGSPLFGGSRRRRRRRAK